MTGEGWETAPLHCVENVQSAAMLIYKLSHQNIAPSYTLWWQKGRVNGLPHPLNVWHCNQIIRCGREGKDHYSLKFYQAGFRWLLKRNPSRKKFIIIQ